MAPRGESRRRLIRTAGELFRRQGYHGTGLNQVLAESGAPRGSLYFHFPGGKQQLAVEAVTKAGSAVGDGIEFLVHTSDDVGEAIERVIDYLAADLRNSNYEHGCPVGTVALDTASASEPVRLACNEMFDQWLDHIERGLGRAGWPRREAAEEALLVLSAIEGALLLARARRDTAPLHAVGTGLRETLSRSSQAASKAGRRKREHRKRKDPARTARTERS
jgi:TetR/AcrR family transcriptional regulator, lmrAB and yxaGH operons repressor